MTQLQIKTLVLWALLAIVATLPASAQRPAEQGAALDLVNRPRQWARDRTLYMPQVRFVGLNEQKGKIGVGIMSHQQYVNATNGPFVADGFAEREIGRVVRKFGNIAHVFSTYEYTNDAKTERVRGVNSIQLYWDGTRWWISAVSWDEERPNNPLTKEFLPKGKR